MLQIINSEIRSAYDEIRDCVNLQQESYMKYLAKLSDEYKKDIENRLNELGFSLNWETGRLRYASNFSPLTTNIEIVYIRHGQTIGNVEPRIYQGQVDYPENQLNENGIQNAEDSAALLENEVANGWKPDIVLVSPLQRCRDTANVFLQKHPEYKNQICDELKEIAFGDWDNVPVVNIGKDNMAHLFYLTQNAVVKSEKPHVKKMNSCERIEPESFIDLIFRIAAYLKKLNKDALLFHKGQKENEKLKVVIFGHSMAGAAVRILTGNGEFDEDGLGFDGKFILPHGKLVKLCPKYF